MGHEKGRILIKMEYICRQVKLSMLSDQSVPNETTRLLCLMESIATEKYYLSRHISPNISSNPWTTICDSYYNSINCSLGFLHQWNCKVDHSRLIRIRLSSSFEIVFGCVCVFVSDNIFFPVIRPQCLHQCIQTQSFVLSDILILYSHFHYCETFHFFSIFQSTLTWSNASQQKI